MPTDAELMERVRAGDLEAFDLLVSRYERKLLQLFHRWGGDRGLAEDCTQEVFVKLYRCRERYSPEASLRTFLYRIATNHWIDVYRQRRVRPTFSSLDIPLSSDDSGSASRVDLIEDRGPSPVEEAQGRELSAWIVRAIDCLGPEHREVWLLAQEQGLKYAEVAGVLGIPVGTVKSRMHAATHALRDRLRLEMKRWEG